MNQKFQEGCKNCKGGKIAPEQLFCSYLALSALDGQGAKKSPEKGAFSFWAGML